MSGFEQEMSFFGEEEVAQLTVSKPDLKIPADYEPEVLPNRGIPLDIKVDKDHAYAVLDTLMEAYTSNAPPYNLDRVRLPHDPRHMPETLERDTVEHAVFLFNVCYYMRGGIKSNDAVKRMSKVYDAHPEFFNCFYAKDLDPNAIIEVLSENGLGFQKTVANQWVQNAQRMQEKYDGDPRKIFEGVTTYEESQKRIQNDGKGNGFYGFQEKMTSMIIYYLMDEELIEPFNFPIPVDLHVLRVSIANEMITFGDAPHGTNLFTDETLAALRGLYLDYANEKDVSPLRLCNAVWMLSESSCGRNPGNTTLEPLGRGRRTGRSTYLIPDVVDTTDPSQQKAYRDSCSICPVQETCEYNIPGTQYYVSGNLIIRGRRLRFPLPVQPESAQDSLF